MNEQSIEELLAKLVRVSEEEFYGWEKSLEEYSDEQIHALYAGLSYYFETVNGVRRLRLDMKEEERLAADAGKNE
jgi:hypothetical protein